MSHDLNVPPMSEFTGHGWGNRACAIGGWGRALWPLLSIVSHVKPAAAAPRAAGESPVRQAPFWGPPEGLCCRAGLLTVLACRKPTTADDEERS